MPGPHELHEIDPVRGLPEYLPEGEEILWQGGPQWWSLCRRAFHVNLIIAYFALLLVWRWLTPDTAGAPSLLIGSALTLLLGALAVGAFMLLAWLVCRTTIYTITNRRVAMQFGIALPINLNLPFTQIESAGHRGYRDGTGDLPLQLSGEDRVAYFLLWPHARPWFVRHPQPMLRCLRDSAATARLLADALERFHADEPHVDADSVPPEAGKADAPQVVRSS